MQYVCLILTFGNCFTDVRLIFDALAGTWVILIPLSQSMPKAYGNARTYVKQLFYAKCSKMLIKHGNNKLCK